jgi:hypothetical protein
LVLTNADLTRAERRILRTLEEFPGPTSPRVIIDLLKREEFPEPLIRAAIWYLIDRNALELTRDRMLRRADAPPDCRIADFALNR